MINVRCGTNAIQIHTADINTVGKTLAYTSVKFTNKDNEMVARGSHTKFVAIAQKDERNIVDELKPE